MRFKIDENLPIDLAAVLRNAGHDALTVDDQGLRGASDSHLFDACIQEKRVLITLDTDFADIRAYPPGSHHGILVFRLARLDKQAVLSVVLRLLTALQEEEVGSNLWVVSEDRIRVRGPED
jgi:predicted nuclease of predicted toxin-antitoxin system